MQTPSPVEPKPNRIALILGLLLVVVGLLLFFAGTLQWQRWVALWRIMVPLLLAALGVSSLWRYFSYNVEKASQGARRSGGLVWGTFMIFGGIVWLGHTQGWFGALQFTAKFWPLLLVGIGVAKVFDFYRLRGRAQFRLRELLGILFLIFLGWLAGSAARGQLRLPDWDLPFRIRGYDVRMGEFSGKSYTFSEERRFPLHPRKISITNRYGNVRVTGGLKDEVSVTVEKVVYRGDYGEANKIAQRIQLIGEGTEEFRLRINRQELADQHYRYQTNLEVSVPEKTAVAVDNAYGAVVAAELDGSCTVSAGYGPVHIQGIQGPVEVHSKFDGVTVQRIKGNVKVTARQAEIALLDVSGDVEIENSHQATTLEEIQGAVRVLTKHGTVKITRVDRDIFVDAPYSGVELSNIKGKCQVRNSHRKLHVEAVSGAVTAANTYGDVLLRHLQSATTLETRHGSVSAEELRQGVTINGEGTRISLSRVDGPIVVTTSLRDVRVDSFTGPVEISSRYGTVRIQAAGALGAPVRVSSENGDIVVRLPEAARARLDLRSTYGSIDNDLNAKLSVTEQGNDEILKGSLNGGGPPVTLQARHANIRLER